jgi:hypothetical protein
MLKIGANLGGALRSVDDVAFAGVAFVQQMPEKALG